MTQWISSVLHFGKSAQAVAVIKSDGLLLQVAKVPWPRMTPPYLMTLDLRPKEDHHMVRVVEIRAETPQACATLVTHLLAVARHACD